MSEFLTFFEARQLGWHHGRPVWITLLPLRYRSDRLGETIHIPVDFITDGASVPRIPLAWLMAGGRGFRSATIHDWAYMRGSWLFEGQGQYDVAKDDVDEVFYESLRADPISGAGAMVARAMWLGVRAVGRGVWRDGHRRARVLNPLWSVQGWPSLA